MPKPKGNQETLDKILTDALIETNPKKVRLALESGANPNCLQALNTWLGTLQSINCRTRFSPPDETGGTIGALVGGGITAVATTYLYVSLGLGQSIAPNGISSMILNVSFGGLSALLPARIGGVCGNSIAHCNNNRNKYQFENVSLCLKLLLAKGLDINVPLLGGKTLFEKLTSDWVNKDTIGEMNSRERVIVDLFTKTESNITMSLYIETIMKPTFPQDARLFLMKGLLIANPSAVQAHFGTKGDTLLQYACDIDDEKLVDLLLEHGASPLEPNNHSIYPLQSAAIGSKCLKRLQSAEIKLWSEKEVYKISAIKKKLLEKHSNLLKSRGYDKARISRYQIALCEKIDCLIENCLFNSGEEKRAYINYVCIGLEAICSLNSFECPKNLMFILRNREPKKQSLMEGFLSLPVEIRKLSLMEAYGKDVFPERFFTFLSHSHNPLLQKFMGIYFEIVLTPHQKHTKVPVQRLMIPPALPPLTAPTMGSCSPSVVQKPEPVSRSVSIVMPPPRTMPLASRASTRVFGAGLGNPDCDQFGLPFA